jgi:ADP-ribose pyrophosphatase YjhB (NUDIX family)
VNEDVVAKGKIFELVQTTQPDGRVFEVARRAPGVRILIADKPNKRLLLSREFRKELNAWDFRLPGGKVFDTLDEFETHRQSSDDILEAAKRKAVAESKEEVGIIAAGMDLITVSTLGATVEWDLYVFEALDWQETTEQELEPGEEVEAGNWFSYEEAQRMILEGKMQEHRIALVLLQWLYSQESS